MSAVKQQYGTGRTPVPVRSGSSVQLSLPQPSKSNRDQDIAPPLSEWIQTATLSLGYDITNPAALSSPWIGADAFWAGVLDRMLGDTAVSGEVFAAWADVVSEEEEAYGPLNIEHWPSE